MSAPTEIRDRPRLCRLFAFIREHTEQARQGGDDVRVDKWERLTDKLCDLLPRA